MPKYRIITTYDDGITEAPDEDKALEDAKVIVRYGTRDRKLLDVEVEEIKESK